MNINKALTVTIVLFLALLISKPVNAFYLTDHTKSKVSRYLDAFFIHVEEAYLDDKMIKDLSYKERITLLGYALGRQAANVSDKQRRKEIFERLEQDLEKYCGLLAAVKHPGVVETVVRDKYTNELWRKAQASMMGFYEDKLITTYGFDQWGIPNIFEGQEIGDEEPPDSPDPKSLVGKWRSEGTNDIVRFIVEGNVIRGYVAEIGTSYTMTVGEVFGVFKKTGSNVFEGKIKFKDSRGKVIWLEGVKFTVEGDYAFAQAPWWSVAVRYARIQ
jgi:hypothetical protein